ncbi:uncharacterized protein B0T15DRAFT_194047 [Chaetomium strumarium]|uniref:Uncharacterized protein n=1 Tax=Chaetomium strumarium TaxID=1170767 RepID=A0AAJ0GSX7_9PEZI|nr:hypothetical protein B0T15DRAFT_194047 [Chaetomium strumarium]
MDDGTNLSPTQAGGFDPEDLCAIIIETPRKRPNTVNVGLLSHYGPFVWFPRPSQSARRAQLRKSASTPTQLWRLYRSEMHSSWCSVYGKLVYGESHLMVSLALTMALSYPVSPVLFVTLFFRSLVNAGLIFCLRGCLTTRHMLVNSFGS